MNAWEMNAELVENIYGGHVDWEERFYECPACGEPIYECDWNDAYFVNYLCPVCEYTEDDE